MNLIYQYWDGKIPLGSKVGQDNISNYAKRIGAEYLFEDNPRYYGNKFGDISFCFGKFKPVYDERFLEYDNVLVLDTDILAVDRLEENIFSSFTGDIGACEERFQPEFRKNSNTAFTHKSDEEWSKAIFNKWNVEMPRNSSGLLKVYNGGLMMFSRNGLIQAKERFIPINEYINYILSLKFNKLYARDQNYFHAMLFISKMNFQEISPEWNSFIHYLGNSKMKRRPINDMRTNKTKFVHIQLRGADEYDTQTLWEITNLPVDHWSIRKG